VLLETASALLRLRPSEDVRVVLTVATGPRSEVKIIRTAAGERFVAKHYVGDDARRRFVAETSVLRMLSEHSRAPVPRLEAVSPDELVIVMREAEGISVENAIRTQERDAGRLVMARYASAIGRLHSLTRGVVNGIASERQQDGFAEKVFLPPFARDPDDAAHRVAQLVGQSSDALVVELRDVIAESFWSASANTLIQWDTWPGNAIAASDATTLIDFEDAVRGNALLDVSSWHLAFPAAPLRIPFAAQLPADVMNEMDAAYESAVGRTIDAERLAVAIAGRMLFEVTAPSAPRLFNDLAGTPIAALYLLRVRHAASVLRTADLLPELATVMEQLASLLSRPNGAELEPYDAFR